MITLFIPRKMRKFTFDPLTNIIYALSHMKAKGFFPLKKF